MNFVYKTAIHPVCGTECKRHSIARRHLKTLEGVKIIKVSVHYCKVCKKHFRVPISIAPQKAQYSQALINRAVRYDGTLQQIEIYIEQNFGVHIPQTTIYDWKKKMKLTQTT